MGMRQCTLHLLKQLARGRKRMSIWVGRSLYQRNSYRSREATYNVHVRIAYGVRCTSREGGLTEGLKW